MSQGKQPATLSPFPDSSTETTNPAANLSSLWAYIKPALDHIMHGPTNTDHKAPPIQIDFYSRIYTHTYNYVMAGTKSRSPHHHHSNGNDVDNGESHQVKGLERGQDLYEQIDQYYAELAKECLLDAPQGDSAALIHYIISRFNRYSSGAQSISKLLNYVNRHFVQRAVDQGEGWLRPEDVFNSGVASASLSKSEKTRNQDTQKMRDTKMDELRRWGYRRDMHSETFSKAEAAAEAASSVDRIVPLTSLAHRRFRTEFVDVLLLTPERNADGNKAEEKISTLGDDRSASPTQKGRLARAIEQLLDAQDVEEAKRRKLAADLSRCLWTVGVKPDHSVRKKLDEYVLQNPPFPPDI